MEEVYAGKAQLDRLNYANVVLMPKKRIAEKNQRLQTDFFS